MPAWKCALGGCSARATVVVHVLFINLSGDLCTVTFQISAIVNFKHLFLSISIILCTLRV